jgi:hypothetical protein
MAIGNCSLLWRSRTDMGKAHFDFTNFYTAGALVHRGSGSELYNTAAEWKVQQEFSSDVKERRGPMRYLRPPYEAVLFSLFAVWPYPTALLIWTVTKLALLSAIPFIVVRGRHWREVFPLWSTAILALGTFPVYIDLLQGQDAILLAFLYAVCFWQLDTGRDVLAGFVLGLSLFKFQFALPVVILLWIAGYKKVLPGFAVAGAIVSAISVPLVGWRVLLHYPGYLLNHSRANGVGLAPNLQMTLRGLLTLLTGRAPYPGRIHWMLAPIAFAAIAYAGVLWRKAGRQFLAEGFGLAAIVAIVTSYYAYSYDLILLLVPLLAIRTRPDGISESDTLTRCLETGGLLLLLSTPVYWFLKAEYQAECVMTLPLIAVGIALARRLIPAASGSSAKQPALVGAPV